MTGQHGTPPNGAGQVVSSTPGGSAPMPWLDCYPPGVDWHRHYEPAPLYKLLDDAVTGHGTQTCTNFMGRRTTYAEIGRQVTQVAAGLQRLGIGKGRKVGLFLPNCPTFIIYYFAILKTGATVVNYNPLYTVEELAFQVKDSGTELMVTLDLAILFDKIEALIERGELARAIVVPFAGQLPVAKSVLFRLFKTKDLAHPTRAGVRPEAARAGRRERPARRRPPPRSPRRRRAARRGRRPSRGAGGRAGWVHGA